MSNKQLGFTKPVPVAEVQKFLHQFKFSKLVILFNLVYIEPFRYLIKTEKLLFRQSKIYTTLLQYLFSVSPEFQRLLRL